MAGLCEGGNEPPGSLKASKPLAQQVLNVNNDVNMLLYLRTVRRKRKITCCSTYLASSVLAIIDAITSVAVNDDILSTALKLLKIPEANITPRTTGIHLRDELRKRSFESWCQLPHKGKGVVIYEEYPRANSWVSTKKNLSSSEYINAIKMSCNLTAVSSVPGRAFSKTRCRQPGCKETETLGHVLGFCWKGELLRNRHRRVRGAIACLLRNKGWEVHEEVHCISEDDSHRRADIIAINRQQQKAIIIDPTIRMERSKPSSSG
ncbi:hypothetical protein ANN_13564 [Periplaneta americana]|uniref:Uncharacterized protein n=1 Tax=Periplaneta americana TaxID=6978 RepID=A0ABQ8TK80_PERAM|nr:hypothetical protein ANN_13564 [Periplaneta americana]